MSRYKSFLRQRYRAIFGYTGLVCIISGLGILSPLIALIFYPQEVSLAWAFLIPGIILSAVGFILWRSLAPKKATSLTLQEGAVIVVLSWLVAIVVGTVPLMLVQGLNFTQAMFESTSGWTTTGLSVVDVTKASRLILLYRSTIELFGGAGLAIITLSAISHAAAPNAGPSGSGLTSAEGRTEQLVPNVRRSAKLVLAIYLGYIIVGTIALNLAGMSFFDAVNHSFAAVSTGGFSTRPESIGYWDNTAVEVVTNILMILGALNFVTSYMLLTGKFKSVMRNGEIRLQFFLYVLCSIILFFGVILPLYPNLGKAIRVSIFETITALSTTGFSTVGYTDWNGLGWLILILLMLIGGGSGSTAGGIKQIRIYILYRALMWEIRRMLMPSGAVNEAHIWQGDKRQFLQNDQLKQISIFVFLYLMIFGIGSAIIAAHGYTLQESLFEYASAMGTVGLSVGVTAADAAPSLLWAETVGMFLGRLEFFTVFVGLVRLLRDTRPILA
ncbi:MAG: TrkH family potassium uptake protein [Richelia sp. RM2_1_2]|nr:TrkH family potassium uptake protein [Richelia sp. SM2_1_7]NJM17987.1 TrkH family potassium uptake protein [Richelia sp. SM1_7_0]NJN08427.1 TrkH family potassium uptake protein [Richelia sp. RM1_1_1]NJO27009.1 TrkH family potassium uptake protein [Richelia sp. SL_2_1]NJO60197.1 TrkH family potassium uptake protein [Richelia sp. RM2_1_2]